MIFANCNLFQILYLHNNIQHLMHNVLSTDQYFNCITGKTDRQKLLTMYEDSLKFDFTFSDEELAAEGSVSRKDFEKARVLLGAITKILGFTEKEKPSLIDNFFDIGGDSLNMVQVIGYCAEVGYMIGMTEFAICSNIADLVNCLRVQSEHPEINQTSDMSIPSVLKLDELKAASNGMIYKIIYSVFSLCYNIRRNY